MQPSYLGVFVRSGGSNEVSPNRMGHDSSAMFCISLKRFVSIDILFSDNPVLCIYNSIW